MASVQKFIARVGVVLPLVYGSLTARAQTTAPAAPVTLPSGTPLALRIVDRLKMRVGTVVEANTIYPLYADNGMVLPAGTRLSGSVVSLSPDRKRRAKSRLRADFTPYHTPVVRFTVFTLADGTRLPVNTSDATDGAPVFRAVSPPPNTHGVIRKQVDAGIELLRSDVAVVLGPDKLDRLRQFIYNQLPLHPERIERETAWTTELTAPLSFKPVTAPLAVAVVDPVIARHHFWDPPAQIAAGSAVEPETRAGRWMIQASLQSGLSSEESKTGQAIEAVVSEPILDRNGAVEIMQGARLVGTVTQARPARGFGRTGTLSFSFRTLTQPGQVAQNVETTLRGADTGTSVQLTAEGQARAKPEDKISVPLVLAFLASRSLDDDGEGGGGRHHRRRNGASGAAGLGLIGTVVGIASGSTEAAAGIGYYGAALAFYDRWLAKGKTISFPKDTRIVVETVARKSPAMKAQVVQ